MRKFMLALGLLLTLCNACAALQTPQQHLRPPDQTFLTFPEWFLVFSPAEYAEFARNHDPHEFPFWGHIGQFWQSYAAVTREISRRGEPFNGGYHLMVCVIGVSTTVEYALRSAYEVLIGRPAALTRRGGPTAEERYGAAVAQDYVDFIRVRPWYEYDFTGKLRGLWRDQPLFGDDLIRKWERRYALTTEYLIKAVYGKLIEIGTHASYEPASPLTAVILDRAPALPDPVLPDIEIIERSADGSVLATLPRYDAFLYRAETLARKGIAFVEIAGNRGDILLTVIAPAGWQPPFGHTLFAQPYLTKTATQRVAVIVPVANLSGVLGKLQGDHVVLEHVFDY